VRRTSLARGAAYFALLILSGCSSLPFLSSKPAQPCPAAVILRPLANTAVFAPGVEGEPRPDNVAYYGILSEVDRSCEYTGDAVRMTLDVVVIGQRGPVAKGDAVDLTYFVAAIAPNQQVISKKTFPVHIAFAPDQIRAGVNDHYEETIPLGGHRGNDITLDLGFQQSPQVVEFYKHFRGR
jgi:hypothetical protein